MQCVVVFVVPENITEKPDFLVGSKVFKVWSPITAINVCSTVNVLMLLVCNNTRSEIAGALKKKKYYPSSCVDLCTVSQQDPYDVCLVCSGGQMQGCLTSYCLGVRVCAMLDQVYDDVHVSHEGRHVKRCQTGLKQTIKRFKSPRL